MRTRLNRLLALALCLLLAFSSYAVCFAAAADGAGSANETPVVFIAGFASSPTVDSITGEQLFPPDTEKIQSLLRSYAGDIARAVIRRNYAGLKEPLTSIVYGVFDMIRCDENGDPIVPASTTGYVWPAEDEVLAKYDPQTGYTATDPIRYSFDWRLDLKTLADGLHDFLAYISETTGAPKLSVIGSSMGACVLSTYMDQYGTEYIKNALFLSGAFQGTTIAGEPMLGQYDFDAENVMMFLSSVLGEDLRGDLLNAVADALYQQGAVDGLTGYMQNVNAYVLEELTRQTLSLVFGRIPGFWSLVPYSTYDEARENMLDGIVTDVFYEKIDFYHDVQGRVPQIIEAAMDDGVHVMIVSKYMSSTIPAVRSAKNLSDMVVDTAYSSLFASTAPIDAPFGEDYVQQVNDGHSHLSCDGYVDASTCLFPEITWFIKNINHTTHPYAQMAFFDVLFDSDAQPTVWDFPEYPQFLVYTAEEELVPLTPETDVSIVTVPEKGETFFSRLKKVFRSFDRIVRALFGMLMQALRIEF